MRSKVPSWHRWSCQIVRLSSVDECHGCGLQDVPSKTMDTSHRLRRALLAGVRASSGIVTGEPVFVAKSQENQNLGADGTCYPSLVWSNHCCWQREEQRVCVLSWSSDEGRTGMPRKASVAEHTTKEKALSLDKNDLSWEQPLLDESGEFHESETPDTMARPLGRRGQFTYERRW